MLQKICPYFLIFIMALVIYSHRASATDFAQLSFREKADFLHDLVLRGNLDDLRPILIEHPEYVDVTNKDGLSLLHQAVFFKHKEIVRFLLSLGADINFKQEVTGHTPLHRSTDSEITQILVDDPQIDLNALNLNRKTPLMKHINEYDYLTAENIHVLLVARADVNKTSHAHGFTVLHNLFDINYRGYQYFSPQKRAILFDTIMDVLRDLVDHGADIHAMTDQGWTPLHMAAKMNHAEAVEFLVDLGADIDPVEELAWRTPAMLAFSHEAFDALETLIRLGTDVLRPNRNGHSLKKLIELTSLENPKYRVFLGLMDMSAITIWDKHKPSPMRYQEHIRCTRFLTARQRKNLRNKRRHFE